MEGSGSTRGEKTGPVAAVYEDLIRRGTMTPTVRLSFCDRMKQAYYSVPLYIPHIEPGTSIIDQVRGKPPKPGFPKAPPSSEYPPPGSGEPFDPSISPPHIVYTLNPYALEILKKAASAGCQWAVDELERVLRVVAP